MKHKKKAKAKALAAEEGNEIQDYEDSESSEEEEEQENLAPKLPVKRRKTSEAPVAEEGKKAVSKVESTGINAKEKCLILSSRGITSRYRHLMLDLLCLIPNCKKDGKLDTKDERQAVVEIADLRNCTSAMFFECRKHKDLYIWLAKTPEGPSVKFHVENIHTMAELKLTGNHLKFSRPVLHFEPVFDTEPHLKLIKELLAHTFATPYKHFKSKPFFDHITSFFWEDGRVWFRSYQVVHPQGKEVRAVGNTLTEAGPRFCLHPIKIFAGAFSGATLYEDPNYVSPNAVRAEEKKANVSVYAKKVNKKADRKAHRRMNALQPDDLDGLFKGGEDADE